MSISTKFGLTLAAIHTVAVVLLLSAVLATDNPNGGLYWLYLVYPDFPVSLIILNDMFYIPGSPSWNAAFGPALLFGIVGGTWWFGIGKLLGFLVQFVRNRVSRRSNGPTGDHRE